VLVYQACYSTIRNQKRRFRCIWKHNWLVINKTRVAFLYKLEDSSIIKPFFVSSRVMYWNKRISHVVKCISQYLRKNDVTESSHVQTIHSTRIHQSTHMKKRPIQFCRCVHCPKHESKFVARILPPVISPNYFGLYCDTWMMFTIVIVIYCSLWWQLSSLFIVAKTWNNTVVPFRHSMDNFSP
jgi:hypothetical protein